MHPTPVNLICGRILKDVEYPPISHTERGPFIVGKISWRKTAPLHSSFNLAQEKVFFYNAASRLLMPRY